MFCPVTYASTLCSYMPWHQCILKHQVKSKGQVVVNLSCMLKLNTQNIHYIAYSYKRVGHWITNNQSIKHTDLISHK